MEASFPRGKVPSTKGSGGDSATGQQNGDTEIKRKNKLVNLFTTSENTKTARKERKRKKANNLTLEEQKLIAGKKGRLVQQDSFQVVPLAYETLAPGLLSLGVVYEIQDARLIIVLPGRATGVVAATDISKPYTEYLEEMAASNRSMPFHGLRDMFTVGQVVVVKVLSAEKRSNGQHNVKLTINPEEIHTNYNVSMVSSGLCLVGAVKSEEDKGYQIDVGIKNVFAFLPSGEVDGKGKTLKTGQLVYCKVIKDAGEGKKQKGNRRVVHVTNKADKIKAKSSSVDALTVNLNALLPGMVLDSLVEETNETGLRLSCGMLTGLVHCDHIKQDWSDTSSVEVASECRATVLYVHPTLTTPYLTLRSDILPIRSSIKEDLSKRGALVSARIQKVTNRGLMVQLAGSNDRGLITINHLGDGFLSKEEIAKKFKPKSEIQCRIFAFSYFEKMYLCSLKKAMLEVDIVNVQQASPGLNVECTILGANSGGLEVSFGRKIKGFVPNSFLGKKKKMKQNIEEYVGTKVAGRIMEVNNQTQVIITFEKTLVKSKEAVLKSVNEAKIGLTGHGLVIRVTGGGATLKTIGGVKGFIPLKNFITSESVENLKCHDFVKIGEVIHYVVKKVEEEQLIMRPYNDEIVSENVDEVQAPEKKSKKRKRKISESSQKDELDEQTTGEDQEGVGTGQPKKKKRRGKKKRRVDSETEPAADSREPRDNETVEEKIINEDSTDGENSQNGGTTPVDSQDTIVMKMDIDPDDCFWKDESIQAQAVTNDVIPNEPTESSTDTVNPKKSTLAIKDTAQNSKSFDKTVIDLVSKFESQGLGTNSPEASEGWYWVTLMKYYASSGDFEKARAIGRQGLEYGPIVQKSEHALKIWRALFALELKFGTEVAAKNILSEAIRGTDDKYKCYEMAASVYEKEGRVEDALNIYKNNVTKECGDKVDAWINFAKLYFLKDRFEDARDVFHTASKKCVSNNINETTLTSKFALLEIYHGDLAKGTMLFDSLLGILSKRVDLWVMYVQALIKMEQYDRARAVFLRAFEQEWKPAKVRSLLANYKTFEDKHGNASSKENFLKAAAKVLGPSGLNVLGGQKT